MARSQKLWVRRANFNLTVTGVHTGSAAVQSVRETANVLSAGGVAQPGLPQEFTVVRFMASWQYQMVDTSAAVLSNYPAAVVGVRTAGVEELEEMTANTAFREESGPAQDPMADWMAWNPMHAGQGVASVAAQWEMLTGKGTMDVRSARKVDGLRDDIGVFIQLPPNALLSGLTVSVNLAWAALCIVH